MRVYLAGPWATRDQMPGIAARFVEAGHTMSLRWWEHPDVPGTPSAADNATMTALAHADFFGVVEADALVVVNAAPSEGKAVETGIALTMCLPVIVIGPRSHIFHYLPSVRRVDSVDEAIAALA